MAAIPRLWSPLQPHAGHPAVPREDKDPKRPLANPNPLAPLPLGSSPSPQPATELPWPWSSSSSRPPTSPAPEKLSRSCAMDVSFGYFYRFERGSTASPGSTHLPRLQAPLPRARSTSPELLRHAGRVLRFPRELLSPFPLFAPRFGRRRSPFHRRGRLLPLRPPWPELRAHPHAYDCPCPVPRAPRLPSCAQPRPLAAPGAPLPIRPLPLTRARVDCCSCCSVAAPFAAPARCS